MEKVVNADIIARDKNNVEHTYTQPIYNDSDLDNFINEFNICRNSLMQGKVYYMAMIINGNEKVRVHKLIHSNDIKDIYNFIKSNRSLIYTNFLHLEITYNNQMTEMFNNFIQLEED